MLDIIICGANGAMGQVLADAAVRTKSARVVAGIDAFPDRMVNPFPVYASAAEIPDEITCDALIDFSRPSALPSNLEYAAKKGISLIIATTGCTKEDKALIAEWSHKARIFFSANMSLGVNLQIELCKQAAVLMADRADIEIVEKHHNRKVDAPSGTALAIADAINDTLGGNMRYQHGREGRDAKRQGDEIGIHAVRGGSIVGEHETLFITDEEIIEINHRSQSKNVFAVGALRAAEFIKDRPVGLYSMQDILYETRTMTDLFVSHNEALITLPGLPHKLGAIAKVFDDIAQNGVNVDIINQSAPKDGKIDLSFSFSGKDLDKAEQALSDLHPQVAYPLAKLTVEGMGMERKHGVAARLFSVLAERNVEVYVISTSETKISFCVDEADAKVAAATISEVFRLRQRGRHE
ncbi:MAG: 4-hydroxy-tetrahydrodipicolinate reductase [Christensenellaceae bacterium]|nr:4-hydroxy-tetrahydrodipicolinate reductase [Christensenellaceae bacterium]